ncbi:hypothetical protein E4U42_000094 [Claviceps africana]|uniref:AAA+ ATPase domain-containing protein n=1 Tax=Claviceps africana TaxID=83212 RepID=A0A8K0JAG5_9HYPO|nr:hypothetical protein E4U42_000094 [Claviceps africana]
MSMFFPRSLAPSALTVSSASLTTSTSQRAFHSLSHRHNSNGAGSGGKPIDSPISVRENEAEPEAEPETEAEPSAVAEAAGGRTRGISSSSLKSRLSRRRTASALPPVKLPPSFLRENVFVYNSALQPRLPDALVEDTMHTKTSRLHMNQPSLSRQSGQAVGPYFDAALAVLLERSGELTRDILRSPKIDERNPPWNRVDQIEKLGRLSDMFVDSAWHLADSIYPGRHAEYLYKTRPFWWWDVYRDLHAATPKSRNPSPTASPMLKEQLRLAESLPYPLSQAILDFPLDALMGIQRTLERQLQARPPSTFDPLVGKRPITILSMSGYGGKAVAESLGRHLAYWNQADLVHLDAQDLSMLVGEYLGLNWAYSRGAVSNMGFRAAELNGKLVRDAASSSLTSDEDDNDTDAGMTVRVSSGSFEDDLQKIKQGDYDCFSKWENLKIDKILDHIIRASELEPSSRGPGQNPILLHLHDIIELSMTLEGSLLIGRLRALVDSAWKEGIQIAIMGTSSCENPSDEYQEAVKYFAAGDWVITRHLEPDDVDRRAMGKTQFTDSRFTLQNADYFAENIRNINRMTRALSPDATPPVLDVSSEDVKSCLRSTDHRFSILRDSILPIPEVYNMASALTALERRQDDGGDKGATILSERCAMGPLQQKPGQGIVDEAAGENRSCEAGERRPSHEPALKAESRGGVPAKLNEYEKRISSGQINRENLRTTFADVHAPQETISALKLLTSLALVRPDAFAYGVLSQDRIPGCLLYGPPGTGKTLLAKAVAKESGANMLEISGATINDKWVGESEKLIRAVFSLAKRLEPCVVFIDEADSLLANRSMFNNRSSHREHINQFLKEWDGLEETNAFIMVATNRPFDLDDAVLRRLPRKILVDLPLQDDRAAILRLLLRDETMDPSVSLDNIAHRTPYYSGSDLKNLCVAAAMAAVEEENRLASQHSGPDPYQYPDRRVLRADHFEAALKQIPASISQDMESLKQIRKFDQEYGNGRRGGAKRRTGMGFGCQADKDGVDANEARIRP